MCVLANSFGEDLYHAGPMSDALLEHLRSTVIGTVERVLTHACIVRHNLAVNS